jgi:hypothetical protein
VLCPLIRGQGLSPRVVSPFATVDGELTEWIRISRADPVEARPCPDCVPAEKNVALLKEVLASPVLEFQGLTNLLDALSGGPRVSASLRTRKLPVL